MDLTRDLKSLWHTVFHDSMPVIDEFFNSFPMAEFASAEYYGDKLAAAAYVLPFGELVLPDSSRLKCAHIYAVAVHPEMRGRGLGFNITNRAYEHALELGFPAAVLHPASESLFDFYQRHCGFSTGFTAKISRCCISQPSEFQLTPAEAEQYRRQREILLSDIPHIDISPRILTLFTKLGGRLFTFDGGCAAVEETEGNAYFRELIHDRGAAIPFSSMTGLSDAVTFSPDVSEGVPFGMIRGVSFPGNGYMGIALE